jgi:uroporphyrinogen III methyltransferase/synthase
VGEATAKTLLARGLKADLVPTDYQQEGLVNVFRKRSIKSRKFLLARAKDGRDIFAHFLKQKGALVDVWPIYENKIPKGTREKLFRLFKSEGRVDVLVFASSSAVDNFYQSFTSAERRKWLADIPAAVIGPITADSVKQWGGKVVVTPKKYTVEELVKELSGYMLKDEAFAKRITKYNL